MRTASLTAIQIAWALGMTASTLPAEASLEENATPQSITFGEPTLPSAQRCEFPIIGRSAWKEAEVAIQNTFIENTEQVPVVFLQKDQVEYEPLSGGHLFLDVIGRDLFARVSDGSNPYAAMMKQDPKVLVFFVEKAKDLLHRCETLQLHQPQSSLQPKSSDSTAKAFQGGP